jgi:iron(III) transport system permease protein
MLNRRSRMLWALGALLISGFIILPAITIVALALRGSESIWPQLAATVLPVYVVQTAGLMAGVGVLTFIIGSGTAWLITMYRFPGRRAFKWALVLPLAIPTYIAAYCFLHVFDYAGPVQSTLRETFGWSAPGDYWFRNCVRCPAP